MCEFQLRDVLYETGRWVWDYVCSHIRKLNTFWLYLFLSFSQEALFHGKNGAAEAPALFFLDSGIDINLKQI